MDQAALDLPAVELRDRLARGALRAADLARTVLERIAAREPQIGAFAWHDSEHVLRQAAMLDALRTSGRPIGPLHGLPVAIKDVIDTVGMPTANGTPLDAGRMPGRDAFVVTRLKQAGALIVGKAVTTELAYFTPGGTNNPAAPGHTPGGSSSGSAAAVAGGLVPLALGTQTAGSVVRPASYCGVWGFKPSFGAIPRTGVLRQAPSLDTIGVFARSAPDAALLAETLFGCDAADPATTPFPAPRLFDLAASPPPVPPDLALVRPPGWETADPELHAAFAELREALGDRCEEIELPAAFADHARIREIVQHAEMARNFASYERRGGDRLSPRLREALAAGNAISAPDYLAALDWRSVYAALLEEIFGRFDAILTPAAPGPAPAGLGSTGSPVFNGLWTFCGTPAVSIPLLAASDGRPIGVQLVGRIGYDGRLLRTARWLAEHLQHGAATAG